MGDNAYNTYMSDLRKATETMRVGEPGDVQNVHDLVGAMGQSFTTTVFAFQQVSTVKSNIGLVLGLVEKNKNADWTRIAVEAALKSPINTLRTRYNLQGTADLMEKAVPLIKSADDGDLIELMRLISVYLTFLARRVRSFLPFYELSIAFEGHRFMVEKAVAPGMTN
jgi:hypothetical protein